MVPHGMSVALTAPEAFRFTFEAAPERHLRAAAAARARTPACPRPGRVPAAVLVDLMRDIGIPNGVGAVGFDEGDIPDLVEGTMKQQRLLATALARSPRTTSPGSSPVDAALVISRQDDALRDLGRGDHLPVHGGLGAHECHRATLRSTVPARSTRAPARHRAE